MVRAEGYELILGSSIDSQFGPVILFGGGGQLVEVYKDRAVGLPPLNTTLARRDDGAHENLDGFERRARKESRWIWTALERLIVRFSYLVTEQSWIKEIDINPLLASPDGLLALDARVVLHPADLSSPPRLAIRPYPTQYVQPWKFPDGAEASDPPDSSRRRAADRPLPRATVGAQRLLALFSLDRSGPARLARPSDPHLL